MIREQKLQFIDILSSVFSLETKNIYLIDISNMKANQLYELRKNCYTHQINIMMIKNSFLKIAMEKYRKKICTFFLPIKGNTLLLISSIEAMPAKIIYDYKKKNNSKMPILKAAYVAEAFYLGNDKLDFLIKFKSKKELIIDIISILKSTFKNVIVAIQSPLYKIIEYLQKNINFNM